MSKKRYEDPEYAEADAKPGDETAAEQSEASEPQPLAGADEATAALQKERDTYKEQFLRAVADFDNYRKRMDRERRELSELVTQVRGVGRTSRLGRRCRRACEQHDESNE